MTILPSYSISLVLKIYLPYLVHDLFHIRRPDHPECPNTWLLEQPSLDTIMDNAH